MTAALGLALAACAQPVDNRAASANLPPFLQEFAAMARFLPTGMESVRFFRDATLSDVSTAQAGRSFSDPREPGGVGASELVIVRDLATGSAAGTFERGNFVAEDAERLVLGGQECWRASGGLPLTPAPVWIAIVRGRYEVECSSQALLESALREDHDLPGLVGDFAPLPDLPADTSELSLLAPRPGPKSVFSGPLPDRRVIAVTSGGRRTLTFWAPGGLPPGYAELMQAVHFTESGRVERDGRTQVRFAADATLGDEEGLLPHVTLVQWVLFGFRVFL